MKVNYSIFVITAMLLFCFACKKSTLVHPTPGKIKSKVLDTAFTTNAITASIVGKWHLTKQRVQILTASTNEVTDTTYTAATFNDTDVYQFNSDSTATFAQGDIFFTSSRILVTGTTSTASPLIFLYSVSGNNITIAFKNHISMPSNGNPGPYPEIIVTLDANTLVLHGVTSTANGSKKTVLDTWLTRE